MRKDLYLVRHSQTLFNLKRISLMPARAPLRYSWTLRASDIGMRRIERRWRSAATT